MNDNPAQTITEAEAQAFTVPQYSHWVKFAHQVDGYALCAELGVEPGDFLQQTRLKLDSQPGTVTVIEARIVLFLQARAMRFNAGPEPYAFINALLAHIAQQVGQPYTPLSSEEIAHRTQADSDALSRAFGIVKPDEEDDSTPPKK